jgi:hypothetical protein
VALGQFGGEFGGVMRIDLARQHCGADQHGTALVALLQDVDANLLRQTHEPCRQRAAEKQRTAKATIMQRMNLVQACATSG